MSSSVSSSSATIAHGKIYYGWVIVAIGGVTMLVTFGLYWPIAFVILGSFAGLFMVTTAFLLQLPPEEVPHRKNNTHKSKSNEENQSASVRSGNTFSKAFHSKRLWIAAFFLYAFCLQMVIVHLVNYATDIGISSLTAASFVSVIGIVAIAGRLLIGVGSDRSGANNSLVLCNVFLTVSLVWLLFGKTVWAFYLFAILFGLAYGGETPLFPMIIGQFFGMRAMAALIGLVIFVANIGGALGPFGRRKNLRYQP